MSKKKRRKSKTQDGDGGSDDGPDRRPPSAAAAAVSASSIADAAPVAKGGRSAATTKRKKEEEEERSTTTATTSPPPPAASAAAAATGKKKLKYPLRDAQRHFLSTMSPPEVRTHFFSDARVDPSTRAEIWDRQAEFGESLIDKYSWATPDERTTRILLEFSPLIEIGCGRNGHWCRTVNGAGGDMVGYDRNAAAGGTIRGDEDAATRKKRKGGKKGEEKEDSKSFRVREGGPEVLSTEEAEGRTLFLCYPDEDDAVLGAACLERYSGEYVIHVGELYGDTLSLDQSPWGRSSSAEFQQRLAAEFHCVLKMGLSNWLHVRDTLSVWKRSEVCEMVFAADEEDDEDGEGGNAREEEDEVATYRHVPPEERMPTDVAAPRLAHLLLPATTATTATTTTTATAAGEYVCPW